MESDTNDNLWQGRLIGLGILRLRIEVDSGDDRKLVPESEAEHDPILQPALQFFPASLERRILGPQTFQSWIVAKKRPFSISS